jgi:hypothetical protein
MMMMTPRRRGAGGSGSSNTLHLASRRSSNRSSAVVMMVVPLLLLMGLLVWVPPSLSVTAFVQLPLSSHQTIGIPKATPTTTAARGRSSTTTTTGHPTMQLPAVPVVPVVDRRTLLYASLFGGWFGNKNNNNNGFNFNPSWIRPTVPGAIGPTNQIMTKVQGIRRKRIGGTDIIVSEMGIGTQRWLSTDFNAPDETMIYNMLDVAILQGGINLIDTGTYIYIVCV